MNSEKNVLPPMKILLVGAGGIGGYFAGRLAESGAAEVAAVVRSDFETVARDGFEIQSIAGDFHFTPSSVLHCAGEYAGAPDYILIATKALPEANLPRLLEGVTLGAETTLVLIQNGLEVENSLGEAFPDHLLLSATAYIGVTRIAPGKICHAGGGSLHLGRFPVVAGEIPFAARRLLDAWQHGKGVVADWVNDITEMRYEKLLWNVPFNPLSILAGCVGTRKMVDDPKLLDLARHLMMEVAQVAEQDGYHFDQDKLESLIDYTRNFPDYKTSMLIDFEAKRPLEVEAIVGNLLRRAEQKKLLTPYLQMLYALLKSADEENRK